MQQHLEHDNHQRCKNAHDIHPCADGKPHARGSPDSGGGGQAADGTIAHKDDPSAQEAYACDDVSGNTGGVQADALHCDNVEKAIF